MKKRIQRYYKNHKMKDIVQKIILVSIFFLALALRLMVVDQSLWLDEAISVQVATKYNFWQIITQFSPKDFNPPLYYLVLHFWLKIFPATEFFIRLPSIIFGLSAIIFIYKISLLIFKNKKIGILVAALLATSPLHIYYSQEARMYSLATFLTCGSMYYFIKLIRSKNSLFIIHYLLFIILMLYSHYLCWFIIVVQWSYILILKLWRVKKLFFNILISNILIFLSLLLWLPILSDQLKIGDRVASNNIVWNQLGNLSIKNIALLPVKFIIGRTSFENKSFYYLLVFLLVLFFGYLLYRTLKISFFPACLEKTRPGLELTIIWLWLGIPLFLGVLISLKVPIFSYFRFLFCLPALYLLISKGVFSFKKPTILIILLLLINIFFSFKYLLYSDYYRENWKETVKVLHQQNVSKASVLILENVTAPFDYYDKQESKLVFFEQKELVVNENTIWLIPYAQPIFDPQDIIRQYLNSKGFMRTYEQHFRGVTLEKWQKLVASGYN